MEISFFQMHKKGLLALGLFVLLAIVAALFENVDLFLIFIFFSAMQMLLILRKICFISLSKKYGQESGKKIVDLFSVAIILGCFVTALMIKG